MRQTGALAAAAAYAVTHHVPLLPKVHELSKTLERGLEEAGCEILSRAETCMVGHYSELHRRELKPSHSLLRSFLTQLLSVWNTTN